VTDSTQRFWDWALERWREPGVEGQLLVLQDDHDLVALEILVLAWLAEQGIALSENEWRRLVTDAGPWIESVVTPLRKQRRVWRQSPDTANLGARLLDLELAGERQLAGIYLASLTDMAILERGRDCPEARAGAMTVNLAVALGRASPPVDAVVSAHLAGLLAAESA